MAPLVQPPWFFEEIEMINPVIVGARCWFRHWSRRYPVCPARYWDS